MFMTSPPRGEGQGWLIRATVANRPKAVIPRVRNQGRFIHRWFDMQVGGIPYGASANDSATIMHDDTT